MSVYIYSCLSVSVSVCTLNDISVFLASVSENRLTKFQNEREKIETHRENREQIQRRSRNMFFLHEVFTMRWLFILNKARHKEGMKEQRY